MKWRLHHRPTLISSSGRYTLEPSSFFFPPVPFLILGQLFYVLAGSPSCRLDHLGGPGTTVSSRVDAFHIQGVHSMFTISLKVIPTSVLAHFGPYHTHFGPKIWLRSGHGPKWVGTEVGIEQFGDHMSGAMVCHSATCVWNQSSWHRRVAICMCGVAWSSCWLMTQLTNRECACMLVFVPVADILNILCDYQFVFSVLDELYVSHHAWCSM